MKTQTKVCIIFLLIIFFSKSIVAQTDYRKLMNRVKHYVEIDMLDSASYFLFKAEHLNDGIEPYDLIIKSKLEFKNSNYALAKSSILKLCEYGYNLKSFQYDSVLLMLFEECGVAGNDLEDAHLVFLKNRDEDVFDDLFEFFIIDQYVRQNDSLHCDRKSAAAKHEHIANISTDYIEAYFIENGKPPLYDTVGFSGMRNLFVLLIHNIGSRDLYPRLKPTLDYLYENHVFNKLMTETLKSKEFRE